MKTLSDKRTSLHQTLHTCIVGVTLVNLVVIFTFTILTALANNKKFWPYHPDDDLQRQMALGTILGIVAGCLASCYRGRLSRPMQMMSLVLVIGLAACLSWNAVHPQSLLCRLCKAIDKGDRKEVKTLLNQGADIRRLYPYTTWDGHVKYYTGPALPQALKRGDSAIVALLLDRGIAINAPIGEGDDVALIEEIAAKRIDIVQLLLQHGADVNLKDGNGRTPLQAAIDTGDPAYCRLLLAHGVAINEAPSGGIPILCRAASGQGPLYKAKLMTEWQDKPTCLSIPATPQQSLAITALLLAHGADPTACDNTGESALHAAVTADHIEVARLLSHRCEPRHIFDAVMVGDAHDLEWLRLQIDTKDNYGDTPLIKAIQADSLSAVQLLLQHGASTEAKDSYAGDYVRDRTGYTPLLKAVEVNNVPMVRLLLRYGANVNAKTDNGRNALMVLGGSEDSDPTKLIDMLIHAGIHINARDKSGRTTLDYYSDPESNRYNSYFNRKVIKALKKHGGKRRSR